LINNFNVNDGITGLNNLQICLNIACKIFLFIGLTILLRPGLDVTAQSAAREPGDTILATRFLKPEIFQKAGELSFNIVRIINHSDTAVRFKPITIFPDDWALLSLSYRDTLIFPNDSISLLYRFQLPYEASSEISYKILFRAYSMQNKLLSESSCLVYPEAFHNWNVTIPDNRTFFYPRMNLAKFSLRVENNGNTAEAIRLFIKTDRKLDLINTGNWESAEGDTILLAPFRDTLLNFQVKYIYTENRVFDISKVQLEASANDKIVDKFILIEKYNDTYAPLDIDLSLPHQTEVGFRTFSGNDQLLPFLKARGTSTFKNNSMLLYNFNYYALTGNEDFITNTYYNFLYKWHSLKVGFGAFSSPLGRNLYTRNGIMASNIIKLAPAFSLEAYASQSILTPKTSVAVGYTFEKNEMGFHGSFAYDIDGDNNVNTGSFMVQSSLIPLFKNQGISANLYGYREYHYLARDYTLMGYAWDLNYVATFGQAVKLKFINNYGSPNIPGPQMGLLNFAVNSIVSIRDKKNYLSAEYINISRNYYTYNYEGTKLPDIFLYDQYANVFFHYGKNPNYDWQAGPSVESYRSSRPSLSIASQRTDYQNQKVRLEYKAVIVKNITLNLKTGLTNISSLESGVADEKRYDFHLIGGYSFVHGIGISFSYDYGPMVNSGLYQYAGDAKNHSLNFGPSVMTTLFKKRIIFSLFTNFTYRFDLEYGAININPKLEAYLFRNFYAVMSGTYHYTQQKYPDYFAQNSYTYFEFSIKKRWGRSDMDKWQKDTRELKVVLFKDDNSNGVKDDAEEGIPFVKTRVVLTNSDKPDIGKQFPVDITLLSNEKGMVYFNRLPTGFYEMMIMPLGDVREYFFVDRSIEKLLLNKNMVYFVPFQKATKIAGRLNVERSKITRESDLDLKNVKITAYNKQGNSYSSFTLEDGSFTIYVPGNNTYFIRMGNVFGSNFKILQNDISITVPDPAKSQIVFNIVEIGRQIKFKEAKPAQPDTVQQAPLKIKVLHGKFYENSSEVPVDKNAIPVFDIKEAPVAEQDMIPGNYYVVITADSNRTESVKLIRIVAENGINANLGYNTTDGMYYVFTKYFPKKPEAAEELDRLKKAGLKDAVIYKY
jgi:hypothetical protein